MFFQQTKCKWTESHHLLECHTNNCQLCQDLLWVVLMLARPQTRPKRGGHFRVSLRTAVCR